MQVRIIFDILDTVDLCFQITQWIAFIPTKQFQSKPQKYYWRGILKLWGNGGFPDIQWKVKVIDTKTYDEFYSAIFAWLDYHCIALQVPNAGDS